MTVIRQALAAALAGVALGVAACGGSSSTDPSGTSTQLPTLQTITAKGLAYSQCMRSHGIQNFPDPTVKDHVVTFSMSHGVDPSSPQFKSAARACRDQTGFGQLNPAVLQAMMANAVKFTDCMRSHGITNYPDPVENGHGIQIGPGPDSGIDMTSARFKSAQRACVPLLPNGGP